MLRIYTVVCTEKCFTVLLGSVSDPVATLSSLYHRSSLHFHHPHVALSTFSRTGFLELPDGTLSE